MGKSKKKHAKKHKEVLVEDPVKEEENVIEEDGQVNEDEKETDFDGDTEEPTKKKGNCNSMLSDNARLPGFHVELSLQVQIHSDDDFYSSTKHFPKI